MPVDQHVLDLGALAPGSELAAVLGGIELSSVPNAATVEVAQAWWRQLTHTHAQFLAALREVTRSMPVEEPDPREVLRQPGPTEWAGEEIAAALTFTSGRAQHEVEFAELLIVRLPLVFAAFDAGVLEIGKVKVFAEHLHDLTDAQIAVLCQRLVEPAIGWTTGQLRHRLLREIHAIDRDYARRRYQKGLRDRGVEGRSNPDGTATIRAWGSAPTEAHAATEHVEALADVLRAAGCPGTIDQIRADLFLRLLDGSLEGLDQEQIITVLLAEAATTGETVLAEEPATDSGPVGTGPRQGVEVRVGLGTLLGLDDHPAELPGWGPIPAEEARQAVARQRSAEWRFAVVDQDGYLIHAGVTRRRPSPPGPGTACRGGVVEIHISATSLAELCLRTDLPAGWAAVIADIAGQYARRDTTDLDAHPTNRFARRALRRHVEIRDRTCVAPGCRRPARKADLDHTLDHAWGGHTVTGNQEPLCPKHHAMKHEGGWQLIQPAPGHFCWRSPLGHTYWTRGSPIAPDLPAPVTRDDAPELHDVARRDGPIYWPPPPPVDPFEREPIVALDDIPPF